MLHKYQKKNSWVLSVENKQSLKHTHYYFCTCSQEFKLQTNIDKPTSPDILCPMCGNDYFKDAAIFETMTSTKIWKYFQWETVVNEYNDYWNVTLKYYIPIYSETLDEVKLENKYLLNIILKKDGYLPYKVYYKAKIISKYSLFLNDRVQTFKKLLLQDAKLSLYKLIISKKSEYIKLLDKRDIQSLSIDDKLKCVKQIQMLDFVLKHRKEKSIKKALYNGYIDSINYIGYYPYSDYIFSKSIDNIDLLIKLYKIYPEVKQYIFTDETFFVANEFIEFLKQYYTEKQLVRLFTEEMQDIKNYREVLKNWRDTLRLLQTRNAFQSLEEHFLKVKLTTKRLHDEIVRIFNLVAYELEGKETFDYDKRYLTACNKHEDLEFKLPNSIRELSLWAGILHNCMLGYRRRIHEGRSIIYGVFKAEQLLYAVELKNLNIVQAKAVWNKNIPEDDMKIIRGWRSNFNDYQVL